MIAATVLAYVGGYLFLLFLAVCIATGLQYLAELVEEFSRLTRRVLWWAIRAVAALHALVWLVDGAPLLTCATGAAAHAAYGRMLRRFPYVEVYSADSALGAALFIASNWLWARYWLSTYEPVAFALLFVLPMAWLVPFGLFLSLAAYDFALPGAGSDFQPGSGSGAGGPAYGVFGGSAGASGGGGSGGGGKRQNLALQFLGAGRAARDRALAWALPGGLPKALAPARDPAKERMA